MKPSKTSARGWRFTAVLEEAEEGGYVVKCLELPVATQGETKEEALGNIRDAVEGYLEVRAGILGKTDAKRQMVEMDSGFMWQTLSFTGFKC